MDEKHKKELARLANEEERSVVFNSGILDMAAQYAQIPYRIIDDPKASPEALASCGWNGHYLSIGDAGDCDGEDIIQELAYCLVVPPEKRLPRHIREQRLLSLSPKALQKEEIVMTRTNVLAAVYLRALGFDVHDYINDTLDCGRPYRYPFDPNSPFDLNSPFLVWGSKDTQRDIKKAFSWLKKKGFFDTPFTKRASEDVEYIFDNLIRYRTEIPIQPPLSYNNESYRVAAGHPLARSGELAFNDPLTEEEIQEMQARTLQLEQNYYIPRREAKEGLWRIFYLKPKGMQDPFEDEPPEWLEEDFESETEAFNWLLSNINQLPSKNWDDYLILSEEDVGEDDEDDDFDDFDEF